MAAREEAIVASRIRTGDTLAMYLATGKKKHDRVFWIDTAGLPCMVCWGKKKGGRSFKREELKGVEPKPAIESARELFDAIDTDGSGALDGYELGLLYQRARGEKLRKKNQAAAMREMDRSRDGSISFSEFSAWWRENGGDLEKHRERAMTIRAGTLALLVVAPDLDTKARWIRGCRAALHGEGAVGAGVPLPHATPAPQLTKPGKKAREALFAELDADESGGITIAEIDQALHIGSFGRAVGQPGFDHKLALMRAYRAADANADTLIDSDEFARLLDFFVFFHNCAHVFDDIKTDYGSRLGEAQFAQGSRAVGLRLTDAEAAAAFAECAGAGGRSVHLKDFCTWSARRRLEQMAQDPPAPPTGTRPGSRQELAATLSAERKDTTAEILPWHKPVDRAAVAAEKEALRHGLTQRWKSLSYGQRGQDPSQVFAHFDRDNTGELDEEEFRNAVRRAGKITSAMMSDAAVSKLFRAVDSDGNGTVGLDELTDFIWEGESLVAAVENEFSVTEEGGKVVVDPSHGAWHVAPPEPEPEPEQIPSAEADQALLPASGPAPATPESLRQEMASSSPISAVSRSAKRLGSGRSPRLKSGKIARIKSVEPNASDRRVGEWNRERARRRHAAAHASRPTLLDSPWRTGDIGAAFIHRKQSGSSPPRERGDYWQTTVARRKSFEASNRSVFSDNVSEVSASPSAVSTNAWTESSLIGESTMGAEDLPDPRSFDKTESVTATPVRSPGLGAKTTPQPSVSRPVRAADGAGQQPSQPLSPRSQQEIGRLKKSVRQGLSQRWKSLSYGQHGQDPSQLFAHFDVDNSGELDILEFTNAVRKGGQITAKTMSDAAVEKLFRAVDTDGGGTVGLEELIAFIWHGKDPQAREVGRDDSMLPVSFPPAPYPTRPSPGAHNLDAAPEFRIPEDELNSDFDFADAEDGTEPRASNGGMLKSALEYIEKKTGLDIDHDGAVGGFPWHARVAALEQQHAKLPGKAHRAERRLLGRKIFELENTEAFREESRVKRLAEATKRQTDAQHDQPELASAMAKIAAVHVWDLVALLFRCSDLDGNHAIDKFELQQSRVGEFLMEHWQQMDMDTSNSIDAAEWDSFFHELRVVLGPGAFATSVAEMVYHSELDVDELLHDASPEPTGLTEASSMVVLLQVVGLTDSEGKACHAETATACHALAQALGLRGPEAFGGSVGKLLGSASPSHVLEHLQEAGVSPATLIQLGVAMYVTATQPAARGFSRVTKGRSVAEDAAWRTLACKPTASHLQAMWDGLDANRDPAGGASPRGWGFISREELLSSPYGPMLRPHWQGLDQDGDARVSAAEFTLWFCGRAASHGMGRMLHSFVTDMVHTARMNE